MPQKRIIGAGRTIRETADIYGLTIDHLYYYEKIGLVVPKRNPSNSYRIYDALDFFKLNVITELRSMDFSFKQIKDYFENHTLSSTMSIMDDELRVIDEQIAYLSSIRKRVTESIQGYESAQAAVAGEEILIQHMPSRACALVSQEELHHTNIPFAIAQYCSQYNIPPNTFHSTTCYEVDVKRTDDLGLFLPLNTFLCSDSPHFVANHEIAQGLYARCTFQGSFMRCPEIYSKIVQEIKRQGYLVNGSPLEVCLIGEYESEDRDEYVSRVEVPIIHRTELDSDR